MSIVLIQTTKNSQLTSRNFCTLLTSQNPFKVAPTYGTQQQNISAKSKVATAGKDATVRKREKGMQKDEIKGLKDLKDVKTIKQFFHCFN